MHYSQLNNPCSSSFSEGAGEKCHTCCRKAIELSPSNPEAHQLLSSCLLSLGKEEEAKESLMTGVSLWLPSKVGGASSSEGGASVEATPSSSFPPYFSRVNTAKLLLEVQEYEVCVSDQSLLYLFHQPLSLTFYATPVISDCI